MQNKLVVVALLVIVTVGFFLVQQYLNGDAQETDEVAVMAPGSFAVRPVEHASFLLEFGGVTIANDPVGDTSAYQLNGTVPVLILLTDIHPDHLSVETLSSMTGASTTLIAPQAVFDELTTELQEQTVVMGNGDVHSVAGVSIEAIPMYNLPETEDAFHTKGRGNGYLLEQAETRIYIAGDTADIPEMRNLDDIDVAFIPMNLPYTMDVETAADAVLDFAPSVVYPYHFRGTDGLADISEFKRIVLEGNPGIEVIELDWYPGN